MAALAAKEAPYIHYGFEHKILLVEPTECQVITENSPNIEDAFPPMNLADLVLLKKPTMVTLNAIVLSRATAEARAIRDRPQRNTNYSEPVPLKPYYGLLGKKLHL